MTIIKVKSIDILSLRFSIRIIFW